MNQVIYRCPKCSAEMSFNPEANVLECANCATAYTQADFEAALREAQAQTALEWERQAGSGQEMSFAEFPEERLELGGDMKAYVCPACGGRFITAGPGPDFCAYCHGASLTQQQLAHDRAPTRMIPFQLDKETAMEMLRSAVKRRPLLPGSLRRLIKRGQIAGLYVPCRLYGSEVDALMQGEAQNVSTWSDKNYRYTKTDTYRIDRAATMVFENVPADGSPHMSGKLMQKLGPYNYKQMTEFSADHLSGYWAEGYEADAQKAGKMARDRVHAGIEQKMSGLVQGYSSFQVTELKARTHNNYCQYVWLPVWVFTSNHKGKKYIYAMNGQTGKVAGSLPASWARLAGISGAAFALSYLLFVLGGMIL